MGLNSQPRSPLNLINNNRPGRKTRKNSKEEKGMNNSIKKENDFQITNQALTNAIKDNKDKSLHASKRRTSIQVSLVTKAARTMAKMIQVVNLPQEEALGA